MTTRAVPENSMVLISGGWLDPAEGLPILQRYPALALQVPFIQAAHQGLLGLGAELSPEAAPLKAKEAAADALYDQLARGFHLTLSGLALLRPASAASFESLRDHLLPLGLKETTESYAHEAGNAALAASRLTEADVTLLRGLLVSGSSLEAEYAAWVQAGADLGKLEQQRAVLVAAQKAAPKQKVVAARVAWAETATTVEQLAAQCKVTAEEDATLFSLLRKSVAESKRRSPNAAAAATAPADPAKPSP